MLYSGFREKIRSGVPVCGCTINIFAPEQVEQMGLLGFDFAFLDNEHGPFSDRELLQLIARHSRKKSIRRNVISNSQIDFLINKVDFIITKV